MRNRISAMLYVVVKSDGKKKRGKYGRKFR